MFVLGHQLLHQGTVCVHVGRQLLRVAFELAQFGLEQSGFLVLVENQQIGNVVREQLVPELFKRLSSFFFKLSNPRKQIVHLLDKHLLPQCSQSRRIRPDILLDQRSRRHILRISGRHDGKVDVFDFLERFFERVDVRFELGHALEDLAVGFGGSVQCFAMAFDIGADAAGQAGGRFLWPVRELRD